MRKLAILTIFSFLITPIISEVSAASSSLTKKSSTKKKKRKYKSRKKRVRSTTKVVKRYKKKKEKKFGLTLDATVNSNLNGPSSNDFALDTDLAVTPTYKVGAITILGVLSGNKNFQGERKFELNDAYFGLGAPIKEFEYVNINGLALAYLPTSEASKASNLKSGFFLAPILNLNASRFYLKNFAFDFRPGVRVNFHGFETAPDGKSNNQYSISGRFRIHYSFTDKMTLTLSNTYGRNITYLGNTSDFYSLSQTLTYAVSDEAEVSLGHSKGGNPLAANGKETEIEIFDSRSSKVYTGLSYEF